MNKDIILNFIKAINIHNPALISELMHEEHAFIDAHGNIMSGKDTMKAGWTGYFRWFPDYKIEVTDMYEYGDTFVLFGFASATYKGVDPEKNYWKLPAAWKAEILDNKVKLWQVYCDTKIPFDIIERNK